MIIYFSLFCIFTSTLTLSPLTCSDVVNQTDCKDIINGINQCIWVSNTCVSMKCELATTPCDGQIYEKKACSTSGAICVTVTDCAQIDNSNSCATVKANGKDCIWDTTCRVKQCSDYDQTTCNKSNGEYCVFKDNKCQVLTECSDVTDEKICGTIDLLDSCFWINQKCEVFDCKLITNTNNCNEAKIETDSCFDSSLDSKVVNCQSCQNYKLQCDCLQYTLYGCNWDTTKESCYRQKCEDYIDTTTCSAAFDGLTCTWYSPMDSCTSISKAIEFDRQCDLYVFEEILVFTILTILINL